GTHLPDYRLRRHAPESPLRRDHRSHAGSHPERADHGDHSRRPRRPQSRSHRPQPRQRNPKDFPFALKTTSKTADMRCAYCSEECSLTREHVWPEGFLDRVRQTEDYAHYSPKSGVVHGADYTVRDVCATCNNIKLSGLDQYFCALYDQYFYDPKGPNSVVEF